jgi:hypothetical protein
VRRGSPPLLNRLLSGTDGLAPVDKQRVLDEVLSRTATKRRGGRRLGWAAFLGLAAAAGLLVVLKVPGPADPGLTARGGAPQPSLELSCLDASSGPAPCALGGRVVFRVTPAGARFMSVLARGPHDHRVWYFDGLSLTGLPPTGVLPYGARLDAEHGAGPFEVLTVFSDAPLDREQVAAALAGATAPQTVVVRSALQVGQ